VNILRIISQNHLLIRLFLVCSVLVVLFIGNVYSQNKNATESNSTSGNQNAVKELNENETKLNEQMLELRKQIAELTQKVGDNKQAYYDSAINSWTFIFTIISIFLALILAILGIFGWRSISNIRTDNKNDIDKNKVDLLARLTKNEEIVKEIKEEIKSDVKERINDLKDRFKVFNEEQKERFEKFEKDSNERIDRRGSDLQTAIQKAIESSFVSQLNELSEQSAELKNEIEYLKAKIEQPKTTPKSEYNEFDNEVKLIPSKGGNAFDEK
jgi:peptidoglycan hydrolase CwlO-like protein